MSVSRLLCGFLLAVPVGAQQTLSFPTKDGGVVYADSYGHGDRAVVLAHGGRFNKESWAPQAKTLASAGFRVLAIDFRGYGKSKGPGQSDIYTAPLDLDVLATVRYLRNAGSTMVAVMNRSSSLSCPAPPTPGFCFKPTRRSASCTRFSGSSPPTERRA